MKCVDLFSGIGGFALACHANGIKTCCFVEKDERRTTRRCTRTFERRLPGATRPSEVTP